MKLKEKLHEEIEKIKREIDYLEEEINEMESDAQLLKNLYIVSNKKLEDNALIKLFERMNRVLNKIKYQHLIKELKIIKNIIKRFKEEVRMLNGILNEAQNNNLLLKFIEKDLISIKYSIENIKLSLKYIKEIYKVEHTHEL